jgi:precorrin-6B methylase 2
VPGVFQGLKAAIKRRWPDEVNGYRLYRDLVRNHDSYLHTTGWLKSLESFRPIDADGRPVPWMNYAVVHLLQQRLPRDAVIYEYGSGSSTLFWSERVARVVSLEYDKGWFALVTKGLPANATVEFCAQDVDGAYCRMIGRTGLLFDAVFIDGRDRVHCVKQGRLCLAPRGVLVLDDSDRERYGEAHQFMRQEGFLALSIRGLKPTGCGTDETTIFYRLGNCLGL